MKNIEAQSDVDVTKDEKEEEIWSYDPAER